jgi:hypothetical protein
MEVCKLNWDYCMPVVNKNVTVNTFLPNIGSYKVINNNLKVIIYVHVFLKFSAFIVRNELQITSFPQTSMH